MFNLHKYKQIIEERDPPCKPGDQLQHSDSEVWEWHPSHRYGLDNRESSIVNVRLTLSKDKALKSDLPH